MYSYVNISLTTNALQHLHLKQDKFVQTPSGELLIIPVACHRFQGICPQKLSFNRTA